MQIIFYDYKNHWIEFVLEETDVRIRTNDTNELSNLYAPAPHAMGKTNKRQIKKKSNSHTMSDKMRNKTTFWVHVLHHHL